MRFTFQRKNNDTYYIVYRSQNNIYRAVLNPSEKFITYLENRKQAFKTENK